MGLIAVVLGFSVLIAMTMDFSEEDNDEMPTCEDGDEPLSRSIEGSPGPDLLGSETEVDCQWDTANPDLWELPSESPTIIRAGHGDDTLVGDNGDELWGEEGQDTFVVGFEPGKNEIPVQLPDFQPGTDFTLVRLGGAANNALSDDPVFDLSARIEVQHKDDQTQVLVDEETMLQLPHAPSLAVKWVSEEPELNQIYTHQNVFYNLDGTIFRGELIDIDVLIVRSAQFSS
ncbi:hypothetical protein [Thalassobius sp. MITS945101]|uniref:hypothetical protein n=1 Tax=Thalassobius sp. MITS945101 TaxID=3096994 RepID=UPI00399A7F48